MTGAMPAGYRIQYIHWPKPRQEKDRGSGYLNLSARERNRAAVDQASKIWVLNGDTICVPYWLREKFEAALKQKVKPPERGSMLLLEPVPCVDAVRMVERLRRAKAERASDIRVAEALMGAGYDSFRDSESRGIGK